MLMFTAAEFQARERRRFFRSADCREACPSTDRGAKGYIDQAIETLEPASCEKVPLCEIKMEGGQTKLVEVPVPKDLQ